ncbi:MAG: hypothetical protein OXP69_20815 [Spirochaetaceae bacterium]|nr:hypothetical protein [Spirochaetaceae bacterium]
MSQPSTTADHVKSFVEHVTYIRGLDRIMDELFQNPAAQAIMNKTAPQFMMKMNREVLNSVIGAMCRITEPAKSHGQQNLTVQAIVKGTQWTEGRDSEAKCIAQRCDGFYRQLKEGRHKLLAHNDLKIALDDQWSPFPLPPSIGKDVIEQLESLIKLAYEQYGIRGDGRVILLGDEREFIKRLNDSLLYERALKDCRLPKELQSDMIVWRLESSRELFS